MDEILKAVPTAPKKRRHTILRLFERLLDERGLDGGQTTVRDHVRPRRLSLEKGFVPRAHPPGHAQADFGEAWSVLDGVRRKVQVLVVDPPWSDAIFPKTHLAETAEERRTPAARERSDRAAPRLPRILRRGGSRQKTRPAPPCPCIGKRDHGSGRAGIPRRVRAFGRRYHAVGRWRP